MDTLVRMLRALIRKIDEVTETYGVVDAQGRCSLGNDVRIFAIYHPAAFEDAFEAWAFHPSCGSVPMPYSWIKEATEKVKTRVLQRIMSVEYAKPPISIPSASRSAELLRIGHIAIGEHPDLMDAAGGRIDALVRNHLPDLIMKHRKAAASCMHEYGRKRIDAELEEGLDIVAETIAGALGALGDEPQNDLMDQLTFLRMRHPDAAVGGAKTKPAKLAATA